MARQHNRLYSLPEDRLNRKVFMWASQKRGINSRGWPGRACNFLNSVGVDITLGCFHIQDVFTLSFDKDVYEWLSNTNRVNAQRGQGGNKLRTYSKFQTNFETEHYVQNARAPASRLAFVKF